VRLRNGLRGAALVAAGALVLTACGGNGDGSAQGGGDGEVEPLQLGSILPQTGDLAFLGPPQEQAIGYAVETINEAGGVLGEEMPSVNVADESDQASIASESADALLRDDVDAIIGAAASGMSLAIVDRINESGVVQCSPANTAPTFTDLTENTFYFRTAPSDALQGPVLANLILADGHSSVALVGRGDDYGRGLINAVATSFEQAGGQVVHQDTYDPQATNYAPVVGDITSADPDAVVIVSFEEGVQILQGLVEAGYGPQDGTGIYGADGLNDPNLGSLVSESDPSVMAGMKGTAPASPDVAEFQEGLQEYAPDLEGFQFAGQAFDCVTLVALAAEQAESTDPTVFVEEMQAVSREGTECTSFEECRDLIADGEDIDYQGVSGPIDWTDVGDPNQATIGIYEVNEEGTVEDTGTEDASMDDIQ